MMEYIKKVRQCIKWYQKIEKGYLMEQEKLRDSLQTAENKRDETGTESPTSIGTVFVYVISYLSF